MQYQTVTTPRLFHTTTHLPRQHSCSLDISTALEESLEMDQCSSQEDYTFGMDKHA